MAARLAWPPPGWWAREGLVVVVVIAAALLASLMAVSGGSIQRTAGKPVQAVATIQFMRAEGHGLAASGEPLVEVQVNLPDGSPVRLVADLRTLARCRTGGPIRLEGARVNAGWVRWQPAARPC